MRPADPTPRRVAIACGGTGGHLFPGLAVAEELRRRGCAITLLISPKEVDQVAVRNVTGMERVVLPAIGLTGGRLLAFTRGFVRSYRAARAAFAAQPPWAALAMGGFTCAPPVLAAKRGGAVTFLHDSNAIPGRANRWLSWVVDQAFLGFPAAAERLHTNRVAVTGTPVRAGFRPRDAGECRLALGLDPLKPVLLIMGGSQGASGVNNLMLAAAPLLAADFPGLQCFHLAGPADADKLREAYGSVRLRAVVHPFFDQMELALGAATLAISRAGASSLAELAAMRLPAVLVPYPAAADDHQFHNARALVQSGAAELLEQRSATAASLAGRVARLLRDDEGRQGMRDALAQWHTPQAAAQIAETILARWSQVPARLMLAGPSGAQDSGRRGPERNSGSAGGGSVASDLAIRPGGVA
jgi:UDP-N-acetylglucosamine--N-acetylmuramyl-(pentapeptide) pyrophosphoryl-undecaprenol N-acetylglucosamine transferase